MAPLVTRLTRRFERTPLAKPNLAYFLWRFAANGVRSYRAATTSPAFGDTSAIVRELTDQGIVAGPSDRFLSEAGRTELARGSARILDASRADHVQAIVAGTSPAKNKKAFRVDLLAQAISAHHPLVKVALDAKLLEIVAGYLGMWPCLHSIGAWLNYPTNAAATSSQLWHHDPEDLKIIKAFIYLEDVGEENGPFTYIPRTHPFGADVIEAAKQKTKERLEDNQISNVFAPHAWRVCTGPANTMILADTVGYHRGGKPTSGQRILVTFTYTSGTPLADPALVLKGAPDWLSSSMQRYALTHVRVAVPATPREPKPSAQGR